MKNAITIIAIFAITITSAFANTTPKTLISTAEVEVVTVGHLDFFNTANFDAESENLVFTTNNDISVIQIFNETGQLEFQLPVMSSNVQVNKNLFNQGTSKVGFILEGETQVHFTKVTVK